MMTTAHEGRRPADEVVVGYDGSEGAITALGYALRVAAVLDAPVRVVHVAPAHRPRLPLSVLMEDAVVDSGHRILGDAVSRASDIAPQVACRTELRVGSRRTELVRSARRAQLLVLGRRVTPFEPLVTGATIAAVCSASACPVRVVPSDWRPADSSRSVVVGVKDIATSDELLRRGFALAGLSGGELVAVHAWDLPARYDDLVGAAELENREADERLALSDAVAAVGAASVDVVFRTHLVRAKPVAALLAEAEGADLLLVGSHSANRPLGHLGSVARALLRISPAPVEIGPPGEERSRVFDLTLERDGAMLR